MKNSRNKNRITVFPDPALTYGGSIFCLCIILSLLALAIFIIPRYKEKIVDDNNIVGLYFMISIYIFGFIISLILCSRRWYSRFTFTSDGIIIKIPFKKTVIRPYKDFPYIRLGGYFHGTVVGSLGKWRKFIVFTNRLIKADELYSINNVVCSADLIKVKYSKRAYKKMCEILPPKAISALERELTKQFPASK